MPSTWWVKLVQFFITVVLRFREDADMMKSLATDNCSQSTGPALSRCQAVTSLLQRSLSPCLGFTLSFQKSKKQTKKQLDLDRPAATHWCNVTHQTKWRIHPGQLASNAPSLLSHVPSTSLNFYPFLLSFSVSSAPSRSSCINTSCFINHPSLI